MRILAKINNNVALADDGRGNEVVVFGKGIGFPKIPYELEDTSSITRVYRDIDKRLYEVAASISDEVLLAASDIVELARVALDQKLSPGLVFTLGDHIQFTLERHQGGVDIQNPLTPDVAHIYPREFQVGERGVLMIEQRTGVRLPAHEACPIALHIVSAEAGEGSGNIHLVMESAKVIEQATQIVESCMGIQVDHFSYSYARFAAHFRYLVGRLMKGNRVATGNSCLFRQASVDFPEVYACAAHIDQMLKEGYGWSCSNEELLYLMMHINRLTADDQR